jgi:hypothetical protein
VLSSGTTQGAAKAAALEACTKALERAGAVQVDVLVFAGLFSPGLFSPGLFSPGLFSPGLFSPGLFSPGLWRPRVFPYK